MKNTFNRFLCFVVIFGIFAFCGTFTSCENLFGGKAPINYEKAYITITTNLSTNARTVLPIEPFSASSRGLTWTLTGSLNGGAVQELGKWSDTVTEESTTTAYNNMISDTLISLNAGTWTFTLTASNDSGKLLEATITQTITGGQNTLVFDMKEAVGEGAASGQIDFTLTFPENVIKNVIATLTSREDENFLAETEYTADQTVTTESYLSKVQFTYSGSNNEALSAGNYILKLELQQQTGLDPDKLPIYETINTYTCLIHVAPGLCSKGEAELKTLATLYEVIFENTEGIEFEESIVSLSYNAYTTFALPKIKEEKGYEYQWHKTGDDPATGAYIDKLITDPLKVCINENAHTFVLYRYKIVAEDDIVRTAKGDSTGDSFSIGTAEGLGIFRDLVNGCDENLKMVDNSGESEEPFVYYETGSSKSQLNATLTSDIDLTQLKDANGNELSWVPINGYSGTFDGGGHTITVNNTYYSNEGVYYQGFFDTLDGATIKNLVVAGEETISESELDYCGGIAGFAGDSSSIKETKFINCVNKRKLTISGNVGHIGGFVGYFQKNKTYNSLTFENCINLGEINVSDVSTEPYVAGFTTGATSYTKCINAGNVTGATYLDNSDGAASGTVAGFDASVSAKFEDCINLGDISANSYTADDEEIHSTDKVYGFSSIDEYNSPTFTNCIDAGSAICPFTDFDVDITVTYNTCYYNSDSYGSNYNTDGLSCMSSNDLCIQEKTKFSNWSYDSSHYPLPNIVKSETTEGVSSEIWQEVVAKATLPKGTRGNPFTTWEELYKYVYTSSDSEATVYIAGTLEATGMAYVYRPVTIMATGNATIKRVGNCTNFFQVGSNKSLKITGTEENNIILDGGDTSTTPLVVKYPLIQVSQTGGSVTLEYCTIQNANCGTDPYGAGLYATSNTSVTIKNCTFRNNTGYDIAAIEQCNNLTLSGNVEIPKLYFRNEYTTSELTINVDENLTGAVTIVLDKYEKEGNLTYDLDLFNLDDGASLPEDVLGVFTLDNPCYVINSSGKIVGITTYSDWTTLANAITDASDTSEFVLKGDITATSTITVSREITLKAPVGTTITRGLDNSGTAFTGAFFDNQSTLTLEGITLDGGSTGETSIQAEAPLITSSGSLTLNNCTLQNNNNSNATGTGIYLQINDTSSLCSFNDVSFGKNSSDEIPHIKIENDSGEKFTFNLGGSLAGGVPSIDMPSTTCINISESLRIPDGESIKITLDEYTIGNRIISANEGINLIDEISKFSLTTTEESWFIDSAGYLVGGSVTEPEISENEEFVVSSFENLLWIALELKRGSITSFNIKLTEDIEIPSDKWQFYQLNVSNSSTIDGQGHSITIDEDVSKFGNDAGGLFYKFNNSTVKNLVLKGCITANTTESGYIGALCRSAYMSTIQNVMSTVTIIDEGSGNAGGLVGYFGGNNGDGTTPATFIKNCAVYANISSENGTAGGFVGESWENTQTWKIENCIYMGAVSSKNGGALIGNENTGRTSYLTDIWYYESNGCAIFGKEDNAGNITESGVVKLQTTDQIASAEAANLLNTNSDGTANVVWEYVEGEAAYPILKSVN